MVESSMEEVERLNPHFRWNKRKQKSRVLHLSKKLALNSFAIGCRGHAGVVTMKNLSRSDYLGSDVDITSLLDGCAGSCSIFHCCPVPITGAYARWLGIPFNHESTKLADWLTWFKYDRVEFDEHYTADNYRQDQEKMLQRVDLLTQLPDSNSEIIEEIITQINLMLNGNEFDVPTCGYSGETFRWKRAPRPNDFATPQELAELAIKALALEKDKQMIYRGINELIEE